jgi:hypothetical protein
MSERRFERNGEGVGPGSISIFVARTADWQSAARSQDRNRRIPMRLTLARRCGLQTGCKPALRRRDGNLSAQKLRCSRRPRIQA